MSCRARVVRHKDCQERFSADRFDLRPLWRKKTCNSSGFCTRAKYVEVSAQRYFSNQEREEEAIFQENDIAEKNKTTLCENSTKALAEVLLPSSVNQNHAVRADQNCRTVKILQLGFLENLRKYFRVLRSVLTAIIFPESSMTVYL